MRNAARRMITITTARRGTLNWRRRVASSEKGDALWAEWKKELPITWCNARFSGWISTRTLEWRQRDAERVSAVGLKLEGNGRGMRKEECGYPKEHPSGFRQQPRGWVNGILLGRSGDKWAEDWPLTKEENINYIGRHWRSNNELLPRMWGLKDQVNSGGEESFKVRSMPTRSSSGRLPEIAIFLFSQIRAPWNHSLRWFQLGWIAIQV